MKAGEKIFLASAIAFALMLTISMVAAQIPMPVTVQGIVTYANGTLVPDGWTVSMENLNETYADEPWITTTKAGSGSPPIYNYVVVGVASTTSTFGIAVSDSTGAYIGSKTFTATPLETKIVNITVREVGDTTPPLVTNPTATPSSIPADGTTPSQLNITVTDASGVDSVTINLSAIGGSATHVMSLLGDNVYSTETTAAVGTPPGTYNLRVNATDIYGNSNISVSIPLTVTPVQPTVSIYTDKTSYTTGERMHLGLDVKNPLDSAQRVSFIIYLETPMGRNLTLIDTRVTLPAKLNYSNPDFKILKLPSIPAGTYTWHAILDDPVTGKIICEDTAEWEFVPTGEMPTEDITKMLEQTTVVIDFG